MNQISTDEGTSIFVLEARRIVLKQSVSDLTARRNSLPRNEKQESERLLKQINETVSELRKVNRSIAVEKPNHEKRLNHSLWAFAVAKLFGDKAVSQCYAVIKEERANRLKDRSHTP